MLEAEKIKITHDEAVVAVSADLSAKFPKADVFTVERFESIDEAREFLHKVEVNAETGEEKVTVDGDDEVLKRINSAHRASGMNKKRATYSRPKTPLSQLKQLVLKDENAREKFNALLADLDLDEFELEIE